MKHKISSQQKKLNLLLQNISKRFQKAWHEGKYEDALSLILQVTRMAPSLSLSWSNAAACFIYLSRWDEAIEYAKKALSLGEKGFGVYDTLAHAYGMKMNWEEVRKYGLMALEIRNNQFGKTEPIAWNRNTIDYPKPSLETRAKNIIAFSLFGSNSKYCETAVLNCKMRDEIYPNWTCLFYVDSTVPTDVLERLRINGGIVIMLDNDKATKIPGPMWRMLAYDIPDIHRIIFRDADSVISQREAEAVEEWVNSDFDFHHMRDFATHTELLLAGMWGVKKGALPPISDLMELFLRKPISSWHFADQYFLREMVWPYASKNILQHDSVFGFLNAKDFHSARPTDFSVGCDEGGTKFNVTSSYPDGTKIKWTLEELIGDSWRRVCMYNGTIVGNSIDIQLPKRYASKILDEKTMRIMLHKINELSF